MSKDTKEDTKNTKDVTESVTNDAPENINVSESASEDMTENVTNDAPENVKESASESASEDVKESASEDTGEESVKSESGEKSEEETEEEIDGKKKVRKSGRKDGKTSFVGYDEVIVDGKKSYELSNEKFANKGPGSAARKAISAKVKRLGLDYGEEVRVFVRKVQTNRIREYVGSIVPDLLVEPNSILNRKVGARSVIENFAGNEEEFIKRNEYYRKHPYSPKASKVAGTPTLWSDEERIARNAKFIEVAMEVETGNEIPGETEGETIKETVEKTFQTLELNPGEHVILRAKKPSAKFLRVFAMPRGTQKLKDGVRSETGPEPWGENEEPPKSKRARKSKKGKKGKKGKEAEESGETGETEENMTPESQEAQETQENVNQENVNQETQETQETQEAN